MRAMGLTQWLRAHASDRPAREAVLPLAATALLALGIVHYAARHPVLHAFDASVYVTSAQALLAGQGYRLSAYPLEPANTYYPPGYSIVLAPVLALGPAFPASLPLLQLSSLLAFYLLLAMNWVALRRCCGSARGEAALALLVAATTPLAVQLSTDVLSDSLFGALTLASILLVRAGWRLPAARGVGLLVAGVLLAVVAYYLRSIGIVLLVAIVVDAARRWRHVTVGRALAILLPLPLVLPWPLWTRLQGGTSYLSQLTTDSPGWNVGIRGVGDLLAVVVANFLLGLDALWIVAPVLVNPDMLSGISNLMLVTLPISCALLVALLWQAWRGARRGELVDLYLLLLIAALLAWPPRAGGRFLWPVAPIVVYYALRGTQLVWDRARTRVGWPRRPVGAIAGCILLVVNGLWLAHGVGRLTAGEWIVDARLQPIYREMEHTAEWVRRAEPACQTLGTNHLATASWWFLYTGARALDGLARADTIAPMYAPLSLQGDPETIDCFIWHDANGVGAQGLADRQVVLDALAARGASTRPRYCAADDTICVYDWRPGSAEADRR